MIAFTKLNWLTSLTYFKNQINGYRKKYQLLLKVSDINLNVVYNYIIFLYTLLECWLIKQVNRPFGSHLIMV